MIAHGTRGFGSQAFVPVIGMHSVSDFDFVDAINVLVVKTAVAKQRPAVLRFVFGRPEDERKQGRLVRALPTEKVFHKRGSLFARINTEREAHEIRIRH